MNQEQKIKIDALSLDQMIEVWMTPGTNDMLTGESGQYFRARMKILGRAVIDTMSISEMEQYWKKLPLGHPMLANDMGEYFKSVYGSKYRDAQKKPVLDAPVPVPTQTSQSTKIVL